MTKSFSAQVDAWVRKSEKRLDVVTRQATNDMIAGIEIAPGIMRGHARKRGTIPRDLGILAASLQSSLYGSTSLTAGGAESYAFIVGAMSAGDVATFSWGGAAAPHAAANHYGWNGVPGTFWIDVAAMKWPQYVAAAVSRAKMQVRQ